MLLQCFEVALKITTQSFSNNNNNISQLPYDINLVLLDIIILLTNIIVAFMNAMTQNNKAKLIITNDTNMIGFVSKCLTVFPKQKSLINVCESFRNIYFVNDNISNQNNPILKPRRNTQTSQLSQFQLSHMQRQIEGTPMPIAANISHITTSADELKTSEKESSVDIIYGASGSNGSSPAIITVAPHAGHRRHPQTRSEHIRTNSHTQSDIMHKINVTLPQYYHNWHIYNHLWHMMIHNQVRMMLIAQMR